MKEFKKWQQIFLILIILIFGVVLIYLVSVQFFKKSLPEKILFESEEEVIETKKIDYLAPDFELLTIEEEKVKLSDYKNKIIILFFWTTWNPATQDQFVIFDSYYQEIKDKEDIVLLAINNQEDRSIVSGFVRRGEYALPVLLDKQGKVGELYKISTLPAIFFINQERKVKEIYIGILNKEEIKNKIENIYTR